MTSDSFIHIVKRKKGSHKMLKYERGTGEEDGSYQNKELRQSFNEKIIISMKSECLRGQRSGKQLNV